MIERRIAGEPVVLPSQDEVFEGIKAQANKMYNFLENGYAPHSAQILFHISKAKRRILSAGRRGGKTYSAAEECAYLSDPRTAVEAMRDYGIEVDRLIAKKSLFISSIVIPQEKNHKAAVRLYKEALEKRGVKEGKGFVHNKSGSYITIFDKNKPFMEVQIKAVESDPDKVRGEFYLWTWWDEPAFLNSPDAWEAALPALGDYDGIAIMTTSPGVDDNNYWFFDYFVEPEKKNPNIELIEWTSLDNPHLKKSVIEEARDTLPDYVFQREYMAKWEKVSGDILKPEYLHYYTHQNDIDEQVGFISDLYTTNDNQIDKSKYNFYIGIDPAISIEGVDTHNRDPDFTAVTVIAKDRETDQGYVVEMRRERISAPDQLQMIAELNYKYNPVAIGIDSIAYQRSLSQFALTIPGISSQQIIPINAPGSKRDRLPSLGAITNSGIIKFNNKMKNRDSEGNLVFQAFFDEWCSFPEGKHDDLLDSLDIAIRAGGLFSNFTEFVSNNPRSEDRIDFNPRRLTKSVIDQDYEYRDNRFSEEEELESYIIDDMF